MATFPKPYCFIMFYTRKYSCIEIWHLISFKYVEFEGDIRFFSINLEILILKLANLIEKFRTVQCEI